MAKKVAALLPSTDELLRQFGARLRVARQRRRLTAKQVAQRAGMAPMTLRNLERGGSGVTLGAYMAVMQVLGVEKDLDWLAKADPVGRELQDSRLPTHSKLAAHQSMSPPTDAATTVTEIMHLLRPAQSAQPWLQTGGFTSSETLSRLIETVPPSPKKKR